MSVQPPPFAPSDFTDLAKNMVAQSTDEATMRCAVGRVYYATFLIGRSVFFTTPPVTRTVHKDLLDRVTNKRNGLGNQLLELHRLRKVADYEVPPVDIADRDWQKNWNDALRISTRLVTQFETWRNDQAFHVWLNTEYP